ncbi:MAG: tetratricopeptide repeat protein [Bryobacteraceae bacterium]
MAVLAGLMMLSVSHIPPRPPSSPDSEAVYLVEGSGWKKAGLLPGQPWELRVSPAGIVWVDTTSRGGLSRYDGGSWTSYDGASFDTRESSLAGGFALDGEEVWGATKGAAIHFVGRRWVAYSEALAGQEPASVAAGSGQVWIVGARGNLSHFDGGRWQVDSVRSVLPHVRWGNRSACTRPRLERTADAGLWLACDGLWRLDAAGWREVRPGGARREHATLVGTAAEQVWVADGASLLLVARDGGIRTRYSAAEMGVSSKAAIRRVIVDGARLWAATSEALVVCESGNWRRLPLPVPGMIVRDVGIGPRGRVWAIGYQRPGFRALAPLLGMIVLALVGFATMILLTRWVFRGWAEARRRTDDVVERAAGVRPEAGTARSLSERETLLMLAVALVLSGAACLALWKLHLRYWPAAPGWVLALVTLAIVALIAGSFALAVKRRSRPPGSGRQRPAARKLVTFCQWIAWPLFLIFLGKIFEWLDSVFHNRTHSLFVVLLGCLILLGVMSWVWEGLPFRLVLRAMNRADYDEALRRIGWLGHLPVSKAALLYLKGTALLFAGRQLEAEQALREALAAGQAEGGERQSFTLVNLGRALLEQERHEEAMRALEGALELRPNGAAACSTLAEIYLRQGVEAQAVLELTRRGLARKWNAPLQRQADRGVFGHLWADRAWALFLLGRHAEAEQALQEAGKKTGDRFRPGVAGLHYRMGRALLAGGRTSAAVEQFHQARATDPGGKDGVLAEHALREYGA